MGVGFLSTQKDESRQILAQLNKCFLVLDSVMFDLDYTTTKSVSQIFYEYNEVILREFESLLKHFNQISVDSKELSLMESYKKTVLYIMEKFKTFPVEMTRNDFREMVNNDLSKIKYICDNFLEKLNGKLAEPNTAPSRFNTNYFNLLSKSKQNKSNFAHKLLEQHENLFYTFLDTTFNGIQHLIDDLNHTNPQTNMYEIKRQVSVLKDLIKKILNNNSKLKSGSALDVLEEFVHVITEFEKSLEMFIEDSNCKEELLQQSKTYIEYLYKFTF